MSGMARQGDCIKNLKSQDAQPCVRVHDVCALQTLCLVTQYYYSHASCRDPYRLSARLHRCSSVLPARFPLQAADPRHDLNASPLSIIGYTESLADNRTRMPRKSSFLANHFFSSCTRQFLSVDEIEKLQQIHEHFKKLSSTEFRQEEG